jgi:hypothetical protein
MGPLSALLRLLIGTQDDVSLRVQKLCRGGRGGETISISCKAQSLSILTIAKFCGKFWFGNDKMWRLCPVIGL